MRRLAALGALAWLASGASSLADLSNPATLEVRQTAPSEFTIVLTLPIISGRVPKARPVLPDTCTVRGEPEVKATSAALVRTWTVDCDWDDLAGAPVGVRGLLGTTLEVRLTVQALDGRRYERPLRPTESFFVIPQAPTLAKLAWDGIWQGAERTVRRPALALLVLVSVFLALRRRSLAGGMAAFAVAQALGQWAAGQKWIVMSPFLPGTLTALTALLAALELVRGQPTVRPGWHRPLWAPMLLLGLLYGAACPDAVSAAGLSRAEEHLAFVFTALGTMIGLVLVALCAWELRAAIAGLPETLRERGYLCIGYVSGVLACAMFLYWASAPLFMARVEPVVPPVTLAAAAVLALWCRAQPAVRGALLVAVACALFPSGVGLGLMGLALPLRTLGAFGLLALLGAALLLRARWPAWACIAVAAAAGLYHGNHAGHVLLDGALLPGAHAAGLGVLVAFLFLACYRAAPSEAEWAVPVPIRVCGALGVLLAALWRVAEYREWFDGQIAAEWAMGLVRLPVLAVLLLLAALLAWPRRHKFQVRPTGGTRVTHWALLAAAFFIFPLGTWRVRNPFHTPRAPTAAEATRILNTLLTDTYLAFNLLDESAAFDRLEETLSEDLVADVYLDSRRRLTAGTRKGAEVTVKNVSVTSVSPASRVAVEDGSFTYPCTWVVIARVKHWQHVHTRQNAYVGELAIRVENDRWKIARLTLTSEEREVLSWRKS